MENNGIEMSKFTEAKLEQAFADLLGGQGYLHFTGDSLSRTGTDEVLFAGDLRAYLLKRYRRQNLTGNEADRIVQRIKSYPVSPLYEGNKALMRLISDGFILKLDDPAQKDIYIQLIDYSGLVKHRQPDADQLTQVAEGRKPYGQDANIYRFVTQMEITGYEKRIPDGILYINGLPLVVFEFINRLRDIVCNFIFMPDSSKNDQKILCRYPQFYGVNKLFQNIIRHQRPEGDGKGGTYFGATGSGKSFTMLYLTRLLMRSRQLTSPTIILITDRSNVICISDEAHRSQINLDRKIRITAKADLIILLAENDYPPVDRDEVYQEILEQAENFKKYRS